MIYVLQGGNLTRPRLSLQPDSPAVGRNHNMPPSLVLSCWKIKCPKEPVNSCFRDCFWVHVAKNSRPPTSYVKIPGPFPMWVQKIPAFSLPWKSEKWEYPAPPQEYPLSPSGQKLFNFPKTTEDSASFHSVRLNHQCQTWLGFAMNPGVIRMHRTLEKRETHKDVSVFLQDLKIS